MGEGVGVWWLGAGWVALSELCAAVGFLQNRGYSFVALFSLAAGFFLLGGFLGRGFKN